MKKSILLCGFLVLLIGIFSYNLIIAQENIIWDESSVTVMLPEEKPEDLPIINNNSIIDWEMGGIIAGVIILLIVGYKIMNRKKKSKKTAKKSSESKVKKK